MLTNNTNVDIDPAQTTEWLEALQDVLEEEGPERAQFILGQLHIAAQNAGVSGVHALNTPYCNTIAPEEEVPLPPDHGMVERILALIRWNAIAMVLRAGKKDEELGGHIASYASAAMLYEVGFDYFFKHDDLVYYQGHSSPGIYARAFLEGRLTEEQLQNFRQEVGGKGLSSYPHPWLMPDFWQFPTVSMGLGPLQAIYQARFLKYQENRGLLEPHNRKVWAFLGDGETDEPESLGALGIASRERLDNLIFVVNCNLQRLDGPVRGNSSIIQELESIFHGANWYVIKVIWGGRWDDLFAADHQGLLLRRMAECVDGDYQAYKANDGAYVREHFFGRYPELKTMVEHMSDEEIWHLNRGGHDMQKIFSAYQRAANNKGRPTVILAKTVKGYGMGAAGEAQNITHQQKKMSVEDLRAFRNRFSIPIPDDQIADIPFYRPAENSPEVQYMKKRREALGGYLPSRRQKSDVKLTLPNLSEFKPVLEGFGERKISTTMAFVRVLNILLKNKNIGKYIVPIVPDECRTFGMEGMFRQYGIYSSVGQLYTPEDSNSLMFYKEAKDGQILEEGLNEAGAFCSWLAAATSYSSSNLPMIPFYVYYSMFGFQRIGDFAWAAGDMRARGFLVGGTAGRTTLNGEGLQHQDGHSHVLANTIPNCVSYDPAYAYELAVIIQDGLRRMVSEQEDVFYYLTAMNENYEHPPMPEGCEQGIINGMYLLHKADKPQLNLLGSGTILREVEKAAEILKSKHNISANVWSVTSFTELARNQTISKYLENTPNITIAVTDYMRALSDLVREYVPGKYITLGTDGFGLSDSRANLRKHFQVDAESIVKTALQALEAK